MYSNILVPMAFDHDRDLSEALSVAKTLAADGAKITALHVMEEMPAYIQQYMPDGQSDENRAAIVARLTSELGDHKDITPIVIAGHAGHSINEYAADNGVDCIIVASHKPGLQDFFLGSTAARVVRHAHCAVHVCR